jgi:hypothetical protein
VPVDVALLSASPTLGWRMADDALAAQFAAAERSCAIVRVANPRGRRLHYAPLIDLYEAGAAWHKRLPPARAVVISSITAAFFVRPRVPYAIRFDSLATMNRPGAMGLWQRALEPRVLARANVLLPWSREAMGPYGFDAVPLGVPIERIRPAATRDIAALAYAGNPHKRRLERLAAAWAGSGLEGRLVVGGISADDGRAYLQRHNVPEPRGLEWAGIVPRAEWLGLLGRTKLFVQASRFEDHGIAPLEALSAGAKLVSLLTQGPYPALNLARALAPALVDDDLTAALKAGAALDDPTYAARADALLAPHRPEALQRTLEARVLPALKLA